MAPPPLLLALTTRSATRGWVLRSRSRRVIVAALANNGPEWNLAAGDARFTRFPHYPHALLTLAF